MRNWLDLSGIHRIIKSILPVAENSKSSFGKSPSDDKEFILTLRSQLPDSLLTSLGVNSFSNDNLFKEISVIAEEISKSIVIRTIQKTIKPQCPECPLIPVSNSKGCPPIQNCRRCPECPQIIETFEQTGIPQYIEGSVPSTPNLINYPSIGIRKRLPQLSNRQAINRLIQKDNILLEHSVPSKTKDNRYLVTLIPKRKGVINSLMVRNYFLVI